MQVFLAALAMSAVAQAAPTNRRDVDSIVDTAISATQDGTTKLGNQVESAIQNTNENTLGATEQAVDELVETLNRRGVDSIVDTAISATQDGTTKLGNQAESAIQNTNKNTLGATEQAVDELVETLNRRGVDSIVDTAISATQDGTTKLGNQAESAIQNTNKNTLGATEQAVDELLETANLPRSVEGIVNTAVDATQDGLSNDADQVKSVIGGVNEDILGA
ncbi:hypothetical protein KC345_g7808, partial [Hortaea werneckii]